MRARPVEDWDIEGPGRRCGRSVRSGVVDGTARTPLTSDRLEQLDDLANDTDARPASLGIGADSSGPMI